MNRCAEAEAVPRSLNREAIRPLEQAPDPLPTQRRTSRRNAIDLGLSIMLLDTLKAKREAIAAAGRQFGARRIRVFGSVARGDETADSDIDFLVDFSAGYDLFAQRMPLADRLAEITGRAVDLIPEHELNRHLRSQVLAEAVDL